ncbi:MAG: ATP-binding protein [Leptolyngbyaceae cyanobacterium MO_188.B28]|nr:ATP-binding protein [Leptolyngbyaceae cyanobacterium MO_188.B28]
MPAAPIPKNDIDRLAELRRYAILDSPSEESFDELTRLAAYICQTPVSLVSLVDEQRQWFKSNCGLDTSETPREYAFCGYTILDSAPFIVEDAAVDMRVRDNPLVQADPKIRFYAGFPLTSPRGYNLGSLCVIDFVPRRLIQAQIDGLKTLAAQVVRLLETRLFSEKINHYTHALEEAHRQAVQASQAKSQFLATISHDIRTPLHGIVGALELLSDSLLSSQQRQYVKTADISAQMLESIISDVLDFSKIEANKLILSPVPTSLKTLCASLEQVLRDTVSQKQLQFSIDIEASIPKTLLIDDNRLHQVLLNLCSNAIKFTPPNGLITLSARLKEQTPLSATVHICVEDTGIGIAEDQQQKIFLPFEQATTSTVREYGGTGLGLAISSRLLGLMGSQLHLQSVLGKGSTFGFTLKCPIVEPSVAQSSGSAAVLKRLQSGAPIRILVAEDHPINQKILQRLLENNGCIVSLANNGKEACEQFLDQPFDLVLMDLEMPVMTGEEAAQVICQYCQNQQKRIPIIALTAHAFADTRDRLLAEGIMDAYLTKPIRAPALLNAIATVLQKMHPEAALRFTGG